MKILIATAIHMRDYCHNSTNPIEIQSIYVEGLGWKSKEFLHDFINNNSNRYVIRVRNSDGPKLVASISKYGEKYVRSESNYTTVDNLFSLTKY